MSAVNYIPPGELSPVQVSFHAVPYFYHRRVQVQSLPPEVFWQQIVDTVCEVMGITPKSMTSKLRKQDRVRARMYCCLLAKRHTGFTMVEIGQRLGRRDHTTVIHALQTIPHRIKNEDGCNREWRLICTRLGVSV